MLTIQISLIIFLLFILALVYQDENRKKKLTRKSVRGNRFWDAGQERRKSVRIDTELDVLYEVVSQRHAVPKRISVSKNISLGGINLALSEKLLPGTIIRLELNLPQSPRPIFVEAKTVWVKEIPGKFTVQKDERRFATGIQFLKIERPDKNILQNFINGRIKNAATEQS